MTPAEVTKFIEKQGVKLIDFKFADLLGTWQHFTTTLTEYSEDIFTDGLGFDGSSIRGWRVINASDMLVIPDPATAWIDVFNTEPTLSFICTIKDPITREPYDRDPRGVAEKAEAYLKSTGIADTAFFGPEAEFFIFDDVRYDYTSNTSFHSVDSAEGIWNTAREEFPQRDVPGNGEGRYPDRAATPRSRYRWTSRNRYSLCSPPADG
jgi:glutamine synthetase